MTKKILFIANPKSGSFGRNHAEEIISAYSEQYDFDWKIHYTRQSGYEAGIRESISGYRPDIVIAAGGDGTINQVATELLDNGAELGIIPAGSANGLAYNLGIPNDFEKALEIILTNEAKPLDAIKLNDNLYCYHLSDIGINARIVKRFEQEGSSGLLGYGKQMIKELLSKRTDFAFTLEVPGLKKRYRAEMLVVANARYFGTGAMINPPGRPDDGEFEIIIIRPYPWWILFYLVRMFFFGKLDALKYVRVISTARARIALDHPQDLQSDGEIVQQVRSLEIEILPSALKVRYGQQRN